ncbi:DUF7261 family protein [Haloarchaeobius sp. DFWS5]|uniref:DUF7261 family protein n=1 Tax=Haloarchaeobius sp. DFWS5 TaxID=3446114 RepID=UPI003EC12D5F
MVRADDRSRAQLVLVGALAIAFIVLGIVVVFNTVLYTENVDSAGSASAVGETVELQTEAGGDVARIGRAVNEGNQSVGVANGIETQLWRNVSSYSQLLRESYATDSPVIVDVTINNGTGESDYGARVSHDDGTTFDDFGQNWFVSTESDSTEVARFNMTVDRSAFINDWEDSFHLAVLGTDSSGDYAWRVVRFYNDSGGGNVVVNVTEDSQTGSPGTNFWTDSQAGGTEVCDEPAPTEIDVNVTNGSIAGTSCEFDFTDGLEPLPGEEGYAIAFRDSDNVSGTYSLLMSNRVRAASTFNSAASGNSPYYTDILWNASVTVSFESQTTSSRTTYTVPLYNTSR